MTLRISNKYRTFMRWLARCKFPLNAIYLNQEVSMIRKYHNHKLQTTQWHHEEEPLNHHETPGSNEAWSYINVQWFTLFWRLLTKVYRTLVTLVYTKTLICSWSCSMWQQYFAAQVSFTSSRVIMNYRAPLPNQNKA